MDISQVYMVRSAKSNDMLYVNGYIYYYNYRRLQSFHWSCNRRKDKVVPCKSRIITKLVDDDPTKHSLVKVIGKHSHGQCSPEEISKTFGRKRVASLAGMSSKLGKNAEKGKQKRDDKDSKNFDSSKKQIKCEVLVEESDMFSDINIKQEQNDDLPDEYQKEVTSSNHLESTVYMLKTSHGRDMICVDGYLYRFEGRAQTSNTCRWECCRRRDDGCKARIQTILTLNNRHEVKYRRLEHTHPPYTQAKLIKLFNKHNISLWKNKVENINIDSDAALNPTEQFEEINVANSSKCLQEILSTDPNANNEPCLKNNLFGLENMFQVEEVNDSSFDEIDRHFSKEKNNPQTHVPTDDESHVDDPLDGIETVKPELDLTKVFLIPSAKGNKMLSVDNFLYHFDSRSQNKKREYWTCVHRRDYLYHCKCRITTESDVKGALKIIRSSGHHLHANDKDKIKKRLCKEFIVRTPMTKNMKPNEILTTSLNVSHSNFKKMSKSKELIQRQISKLRYKIKNKNMSGGNKSIKTFRYDDYDSISSDMHSEDDMNFPILPTKLEQMKTNINEESNDIFSTESGFEKKNGKEHMKQHGQQNPIHKFNSDMDINKMSTLRSAKGGELLCIDDFIYHVKSARDIRTYWECIKSKDKVLKCKSRITTITTSNGYIVKKVSNRHSHRSNRFEVQKRLINSFDKHNPKDFLNDSLYNLIEGFSDLAEYKKDALERKISRIRSKMLKNKTKDVRLGMKLYAVAGGPPSLAVKLTLKALKIPYDLIYIDYCAGEHLTEEYAKMNPQKEIPVLDDNGFYISESIAIMQYICDKYAPHSSLYPKDASKRAIVNQRLCFNMAFYYASICAHVVLPLFFNYSRDETSLQKVNNALLVFETYLERTDTKYAASDNLTIADLALIGATLCLEAIDFDFTPFPLIYKWYKTFKNENPQLWEICNDDMKEIVKFDKNPPNQQKC